MKGRSFITIFSTLFVLACLYQLSFSVAAWNSERNARNKTKGNPVALRSYLDSLSDKKTYLGYTYSQVKDRQLPLGLDLQGGMSVVMEVSVVDVIKGLSGNSTDAGFIKAIQLAQQNQKNSQTDFVTLFVNAFKEVTPNRKLAEVFATLDNKGTINVNSTDDEVVSIIRTEAESAIERSFNILRTRIDKFGVTQPNIQRQQGTGRIIVELPGVTNPERVRKLLQGTAKLEFWETYNNEEVFQYLSKINTFLANKEKLSEKINPKDTTISKLFKVDSSGVAKEIKSDTSQSIAQNKENSLLDDVKKNLGDSSASDSSAKKALSQQEMLKQNPLFSLLNPAIGNDDKGQQQLERGPVVGYSAAKDTAKVNQLLASDEIKAQLPKNLKLAWEFKAIGEGSKVYRLIALKTTADGTAPLEGDVITEARKDVDQFGKNEVTMSMNSEGANQWRKLTGANVGRSVAIVLDNNVYSFPNVNQEISGGNSSISGSFSVDEASDLANVLKAGKLPAPARILEEAVVGPTLGQEAIRSGTLSAFFGLVAVLLFMLWYYKKAGIVANIALIFNIFFILPTDG